MNCRISMIAVAISMLAAASTFAWADDEKEADKDKAAFEWMKKGIVRKLGRAEDGQFLVAFWGKEIRLRESRGGGGRAAKGSVVRPTASSVNRETLMTCGVEVIQGRDQAADVIARFAIESPLSTARGYDKTRLLNARSRVADYRLIARFDATPKGESEAKGFAQMFNQSLTQLKPASFSGFGGPVVGISIAHLGERNWATQLIYPRPAPSAAPPIPRGARTLTLQVPKQFLDYERKVYIGFEKSDDERKAVTTVPR